MGNYNRNLEVIENLRTFMGGDINDVPLYDRAFDDMIYIVEQCKYFNIPQPEIYPWSGGNGIQEEWEYDWYLEINSSSNGISVIIIKDHEYEDAISIFTYVIEDAFNIIKCFLNQVVDLDGKR